MVLEVIVGNVQTVVDRDGFNALNGSNLFSDECVGNNLFQFAGNGLDVLSLSDADERNGNFSVFRVADLCVAREALHLADTDSL